MCGIIGYVGCGNAVDYVLRGLKLLEYRGYDSSGIAAFSGEEIVLRKKEGRVSVLEKTLLESPIYGNLAIGHTRWATHGEPCDNNAHPFTSNNSRFAVVHNGIIENYLELKEFLTSNGFAFLSQTDSEVIANLIQFCYKTDTEKAILEAVTHLKGSYAIGIINADEPNKIFAVKKDNPLILGHIENSGFICSDIIGLQNFVKKATVLDNCNIASVSADGIVVKDFFGNEIAAKTIQLKASQYGQINDYESYMRKEIDEIPKALKRAISAYNVSGFNVGLLHDVKRICFVGCGTALHAAQIAKYLLRKLVPSLDVYAETASEFVFTEYPQQDTLTVAVSQSGETADTLNALRKVQANGGKVIAVCNVPSSTMTREADFVLHTNAGAEIAVASTKAYNCQVAVMTAFCLDIALFNNSLSQEKYSALMCELKSIWRAAQRTLLCETEIATFAKSNYLAKSVFYLGRSFDYYVACEGSLKLKEISYIHSEAYAGGELKHGTLALIEDGVLVVALITQDNTIDKMHNNLVEVKSRGAKILTISQFESKKLASISDYYVKIPAVNPLLSPIISVIPTQFIAYYIALAKGCDIDKPRNLAKSVTVE